MGCRAVISKRIPLTGFENEIKKLLGQSDELEPFGTIGFKALEYCYSKELDILEEFVQANAFPGWEEPNGIYYDIDIKASIIILEKLLQSETYFDKDIIKSMLTEFKSLDINYFYYISIF